jgi:hypothetical protein
MVSGTPSCLFDDVGQPLRGADRASSVRVRPDLGEGEDPDFH